MIRARNIIASVYIKGNKSEEYGNEHNGCRTLKEIVPSGQIYNKFHRLNIDS